ncbi:MAG: potassium transporter TrkG [Marinovum algicola]|jgi:trk system potassium uptake protein TrkH|uniref:Trk system potassium uptake protein TrkH n=1 Tax=Marinovum algicola TaxID=42444 RepID=A0A975W760_9RHOB|nr:MULTISPECIES: potassium transporter TrkG [Marinovum]AKO96640.1 Trk-type K+ transport system, membrane component [Marinovum algicola DG 898]MDD9739112.1 potassium transporter TrkG [Marinovum sp. SP66]MDD9744107.1 potassium transporter TrkG [Marinovum sp. PR37]SEI78746.1 trk system potassium uptake protein TrkH [Marinovum algicola]SLN17728.1 Trk system potassium uptake protein TrkH [Marinovum algicola]
MLNTLKNLPFFLQLVGLCGLWMMVPAVHALASEAFHQARTFFYAGLLTLILVSLVGIAISNQVQNRSGLRQLLGLLGAFTVLPLIMAVPFHEALRTTSFLNAYLEMVSSFTTTGATLFAPERLSDTLHLWRALVGWMGGLLMWIAAAAILAPLNLGGFEVTASAEPGGGEARVATMEGADPVTRLMRTSWRLIPVYFGLTLALWITLLVAGEAPLVAFSHAASTLATSGISPIGGVQSGAAGFVGEGLIFLFLLFSLSRLTFTNDTVTGAAADLRHDPEFRLGLLLVVLVPGFLILRHWAGAFEVDEVDDLFSAVRAAWGSMFTVLSFLSTTGFESADWAAARSWSGLDNPGIILLGLAMIGGGVATTAGGVKLLRVFALYLNGRREIERLVHPSSVGNARAVSRRIRRHGAFVAWVFFMLFAISLAAITVILGGFGVRFDAAIVLATSALSTTGPLTDVALEAPIVLVELNAGAKLVYGAAMVLGRLETLAIIALLSPNLWRN